MLFDLPELIRGAGYLGMFGIVYAETGLLVGMFLPGDSLLFTAGVLASQGFLHIGILCAIVGVAAMLGDNTGYWLGRRFGPSVFARKGSFLFDPSHLERTEHYFARYGSKTLLIARFIPILRTITPTMAGVGRMPYRTFFFFSVIAAVLWGIGIPMLGFFLGTTLPGVDRYLLPIVALIVIVSVAPGVWHILREPENRRKLYAFIRSRLHR